MKREAKFQSSVYGQYIKAKKLYGNFELKQTTEDSIPFVDSKKRILKQIDSLLAAAVKGFYWKYSDEDSREKLFDCSLIPPLPGFIVIKFPNFFCIIKVEEYVKEKDSSLRKSLTSQRAKELALYTVYN